MKTATCLSRSWGHSAECRALKGRAVCEYGREWIREDKCCRRLIHVFHICSVHGGSFLDFVCWHWWEVK